MHLTDYPTELKRQLVKVDSIRDGLGKPIDENIKFLVAALRACGFTTTNSCGGHIERRTGGPYVSIESYETRELEPAILKTTQDQNDSKYIELLHTLKTRNLAERGSLLDSLEEFYANRKSDIWVRLVVQSLANERSKLICQGASVIDRFEYDEERDKWLTRAQQEFDDFAHFLVERSSNEKIMLND